MDKRIDRESAMRRIKACLALSKSAEPNEAAAAMRQAQKLMREFDVEHPELLAIDITEAHAKSRAASSPPDYEAALASVVADAFGASWIFSSTVRWAAGKHRREGAYKFIGTEQTVMVASYTFEVLARKLTEARAAYTKAKLARYTKNKVAAADQFCMGWVNAIFRQVPVADLGEENGAAIRAYKSVKYPELGQLKTRSRELANVERGDQHHSNGYREGQKARVNPGVGVAQPKQLGLGGF